MSGTLTWEEYEGPVRDYESRGHWRRHSVEVYSVEEAQVAVDEGDRTTQRHWHYQPDPHPLAPPDAGI